MRKSTDQQIVSFVNKSFWLLLIALAFVFFLTVAISVTWGLPAMWNIDERLHRVIPALISGISTLPEDVTYPTLPFYTMFGVGKLLLPFTADMVKIMAAIRAVSALFGAAVIVLTAFMARTAVPSHIFALFAAVLMMVCSGFATIAHYAHVDIYLTFFVALSSFLLLKFVATKQDIWLYLGFFAIGLAASSKYNGATLLLGATLIALVFSLSNWRSDLLSTIGKLILAYFLAFMGFFIGTPHAILGAGSHFEQLLPFLERQRAYAGPRAIGLVGQWGNTLEGLGPALFLLFALATIWAVVQAARFIIDKIQHQEAQRNGRFYLALLLLIFSFELPIALSRFYPIRYMVPVFPLFAVLSTWMLNDYWRYFQRSGSKSGQWSIVLVASVIIIFSALRIVSVTLYFENDGRSSAAEYLQEAIPPGTRTEHTSYPPQLPRENRVVDNYPLVVFKFAEDIAPYTGANQGEEGLEKRKPDYLVIDKKSYDRFEDDHVCDLNPVECQFFARLLNDETNYKLLKRFEYRVPPYLPQVRMDFVNVDVLLFERQEDFAERQDDISWQNVSNAEFGENIQLLGYDLARSDQNQLIITLYWTVSGRMAENYKVFIHCLDSQGRLVTQHDTIPGSGAYPTEYWTRYEIVVDEHILILPEGKNPDECNLNLGLYLPETAERLPASSNGSPMPDGIIHLENK